MNTPTLPRTDARHASLQDLVAILNEQADARLDVVVDPRSIRCDAGDLVVTGAAATIDETGVTPADVALAMTDRAERHLGERLGIPGRYLAAMRAQAVDADDPADVVRWLGLYDHNVNDWLVSRRDALLLRAFHDGDPAHPGMLRAVLSDRFSLGLDNLDVLTATLAGARDAAPDVTIDGADLTENAMTVRINAPGIAVAAPALVGNYRSPYTGNTGADNPMVWAGVVLRNSETGGGAFSLTPRVVFEVCRNGMTMTRDAQRQVHIGGRLDHGVVRWSVDTERKALDLITAKAADAMRTFLSTEYVERVVADLSVAAGVPVAEPAATIERVGKDRGYSAAETDSILSCFIAGGDPSALGVAQAMTAAAQACDDGDRAHTLESDAFDVAIALAAA